MSRRLPPLSALRAFEAAARHGSFKNAAVELAVTPTAVSHQVRSLEDHVALRLFERRTRQVVLTDAGAQLYPVLRDGFDAFADAIARLTRPGAREQVTISATVAFTTRWLIPRVARFRERHPDIDLQLRASDDVVEIDTGGVDIAIRYGEGPYPGQTVTPLFADSFAPAFNPLLRIAGPEDLAARPLIDFEWRRRHAGNPTWSRWFEAAGLDAPQTPAALRFSEESHAIQAAVAGQGVALISLALVEEELAAGQLVQPFGPRLAGYRHHVLTTTGLSAAGATVVAWLREEADDHMLAIP